MKNVCLAHVIVNMAVWWIKRTVLTHHAKHTVSRLPDPIDRLPICIQNIDSYHPHDIDL